MSKHKESQIVEAAKIIDPGAWVSPEDFLLENGGYPNWSSGSQLRRQEASIEIAQTILASILGKLTYHMLLKRDPHE